MFRNYLSQKLITTVISKLSEGDLRGLWASVKKLAMGLLIAGAILIILIIVSLVLFINFLFTTFSGNEELPLKEPADSALMSETENASL